MLYKLMVCFSPRIDMKIVSATANILPEVLLLPPSGNYGFYLSGNHCAGRKTGFPRKRPELRHREKVLCARSAFLHMGADFLSVFLSS